MYQYYTNSVYVCNTLYSSQMGEIRSHSSAKLGHLLSANEVWGEFLDELRSKERISSDAALARSLNVSPGFICSVRKGRKNISLELGKIILDRLGKDIGEVDLAIFAPIRVQRFANLKYQTRQIEYRNVVIARAGGKCQLCNCNAPFLDSAGRPYLEVHHVQAISEGGKDDPTNMIALCPNCHRKMEICPSEQDKQRIKRQLGKKYGREVVML